MKYKLLLLLYCTTSLASDRAAKKLGPNAAHESKHACAILKHNGVATTPANAPKLWKKGGRNRRRKHRGNYIAKAPHKLLMPVEKLKWLKFVEDGNTVIHQYETVDVWPGDEQRGLFTMRMALKPWQDGMVEKTGSLSESSSGSSSSDGSTDSKSSGNGSKTPKKIRHFTYQSDRSSDSSDTSST